jgi:FKBP-type peptidyl-prolyl cis-trans isomerase
MPAANPDAQQTLEEGIVYEVLSPGEGETCGADDTFVMHFSLFKPDGELLESSKTSGRPLKANVESMRFPVLQKVPLLMKKGAVLRVEAAKDQGLGDRSPPGMETSVWVFELIDILEPMAIPEFAMPAEEDLETSESGLKWKVLKEGEGDSPVATDTVTVHYAGRLTDGTLFDSSFSRGEPASFPLRGVISGWTEGVAMMKPGEIRVFVIPPDLAYGERGSPPKIGPNETLVFWIELLKVGQ